jgi:hypothetical protein
MRARGRRRAAWLRLFTALALAATIGVSAAAGEPGPPAAGCEVLARPAPASAPADLLTLPVIIHYMTLDEDGLEADRRMRAEAMNESVLASAVALEALFAPPRPAAPAHERGVNDVWGVFGIRLVVVRAERCVFDPQDAGGVPLPAPSFRDLSRLRALSARFNTPGFGGINLYQWPQIQGFIGGYASAPRADGPFPGPGAVWFHVASVTTVAPFPSGWMSHVLLMAHEIGHYLTLTHSCTRGEPVIGEPFPADHPDRNLPTCPIPGTDPHASLMSDRQDGITLSPCEQKRARAAARTMLGITTTNPEEAPCPEADH